MKKVYKLFCAGLALCLVVGNASAQSQPVKFKQQLTQPNSSLPVKKKIQPSNLDIINTPTHSASSSTVQSVWLNDLLANDYALTGGSSSIVALHSYFLFPDSVGQFLFSGGPDESFFHLLGNVFDPIAANVQSYQAAAYPSSAALTKFNAYTVDSMYVAFNYHRHNTAGDASNADTLMVYVYNDAAGDILPLDMTEVFLGPGQIEENYGVTDTIHDTIIWLDQLYNPAKNAPRFRSGAPMVVGTNLFKVPLTISDTNSVGQYKFFSTNNFAVPAGRRVLSAVGFKPGYAYTHSDTINVNKNDFEFVYGEEQGDNTYPIYFGNGGYATGTQKDWNMSSVITTPERNNHSFWDSLFVPVYNWLQAWDVEEHYIGYHISSTTVGIPESISPAGLKLYQNQPNPANHSTLIMYDLKSAGAVKMEITDLMGRVVSVIDQGNQGIGTHSLTLDVSKFARGTYMYTLRTNTESLTRSMVITE